MKIEINNFVVVRFSLVLNARQVVDAHGGRENWLKYRLNLFYSTLRPSIINQTTYPTAVYLLLDAADKDFFYQNCSDLEPVFVPVFSKNGDHFDQVGSMIMSWGTLDIAISRVDSDDILSFYYFEEINRVISKWSHKCGSICRVVACSGYRADGIRIQEVYSATSPFITEYYKQYSGENIYAINHSNLNEVAYIINRSARWVQFIHESNISNHFIETSNTKKDLEHKIIYDPELSICMATKLKIFIPAMFRDFIIPIKLDSWGIFHRIFATVCSQLIHLQINKFPTRK